MPAIQAIHTALGPLLSPVHPTYFPFSVIDLYGAMRLSSVVNWMASGAFDPPPVAESPRAKRGKEKERGNSKMGRKARAGVMQEIVGLLVVVFGGETFLALCTNSTPSWLVNPRFALLFALTHIVQTRTPFRSLLPSKPSLPLELALSIPDAIGRTLLLTRFSVLPILHPASPSPSPTPTPNALPPTPSTLLLVPFILAVPFASLIFSATSFFSPEPTLGTPIELQPGGWQMVDFWAPIVVPAVFLSLIGPVEGWNPGFGLGLGMGEDESVVLCMVGLSVVFSMRAVYNFGGEVWKTDGEKVKGGE